MLEQEKPKVPYREIRAQYDEDTITVYQAYSASIAKAAVKEQKLSASPDFSLQRMTWIKPSWAWMMYRSGYATKDSRQSHILALKMTHKNFQELLSLAVVCGGGALSEEDRARAVRVQWDPERDMALGQLPYRSIQIGISKDISKKWSEEWIESIDDVTEMATKLKEVVDGGKDLELRELIDRGLVPIERPYTVQQELREILRMDCE
ncbi:hypothetical protein V495_02454 [Pseudogymnoascus sp. VKM F-4514 (FW-929)]|nr:hypothetical protein V495_02454 [Pseudogymnoascus sp. VKM F-4514 (FW-929)]KFY54089.1 hypothetical protein V497_07971 [Pseudogymnoascus sp. VKM F-4516 (FW-969)]